MLRQALQAQKQEGKAAVELIQASAPKPVQGAPEPGKGQHLDVRA